MSIQFDINDIRRQFPVLNQKVYGRPLVYLDNAATTQKPICVIERERNYYLNENCNIHRGVHYLSQMATEAYENARKSISSFINAKDYREIIFTRGTTESLNLLATSLGRLLINKGDKVVVTAMEHHSNMVPWQQMLSQKEGILRVVKMDKKGVLDLDHYERLLQERPKLVSITHISNTLGTVNPVKEMIAMAHYHGIPVIIDGAQSIAHQTIDVQELDCDFSSFPGIRCMHPWG